MRGFFSEDPSTHLIHYGVYQDQQFNSATTPIYQTSLFKLDNLESDPPYAYSRFSNPTRSALEENLAKLEGGACAFATVSGVAAIQLILMTLVKGGDHVICGKQVFGGTFSLLHDVLSRFGVSTSFVDLSNPADVLAAVTPQTRLIWLETPTNPLLSVVSISEIVALAKSKGILTIADNSLLTPLWQRHFEFGVDFVMYSTSKYLNGHSDSIGGVIIAREEKWKQPLAKMTRMLGVAISPFEAWLVLRGLKTLSMRLERHLKNTEVVLQFLQQEPRIKKIFYPGLKDHPGHLIAKKQQTTFGALISFEIDTQRVVKERFAKELKMITFGYSMGGVETILSYPWSKSHSIMSEKDRLAAGITPGLFRLSIGLEAPEDIIKDLQQALDHAAS